MTDRPTHDSNSTIDTLNEAFGELERRSDAYLSPTRAPARRRPRRTALLVAASVAVVLALAVLAATRVGLGPDRPGTRGVAGGHASSSAQVPIGPVRHPPSTHHPVSRHPFSHRSVPHHSPARPDIADTFRTVLHKVAGDSATFTAGPYSGPEFLQGQLTVNGVTGGFDIQYLPLGRGQKASCDDEDRVQCHVSTPSGGGSLATGSEALQSLPGGVTQQATYVRPDGVEFVMHVSNASDPKGAGTVGPKVPLSIDQMTAIVTSDSWN